AVPPLPRGRRSVLSSPSIDSGTPADIAGRIAIPRRPARRFPHVLSDVDNGADGSVACFRGSGRHAVRPCLARRNLELVRLAPGPSAPSLRRRRPTRDLRYPGCAGPGGAFADPGVIVLRGAPSVARDRSPGHPAPPT